MAIRKRKPTSPGRRFQTASDFAEITKSTPERSLTVPKPKTGGRNAHGRITSRFRGGGNKQRYRIVDFRREKDGVPAKVAGIEYDPNRNARIALLHYLDGEKRYILAPSDLKVGDMVQSGQGSDIKPGNAMPLRYSPVRAASSVVVPDRRSSSSPRKASSPRCVCRPRKCVGSPSTAAPRSVRSATPKPSSSALGRPVGLAGRVVVPTCVVWR